MNIDFEFNNKTSLKPVSSSLHSMDSDLVYTIEQSLQTFQHLNSCRFAPFLKQHRWMRCTESNFVFAWYSRLRNNCVMITQFENLNMCILYTFLFIWTSVFCNKQKGASKQPSSLSSVAWRQGTLHLLPKLMHKDLLTTEGHGPQKQSS
jgi:hypothetical protein